MATIVADAHPGNLMVAGLGDLTVSDRLVLRLLDHSAPVPMDVQAAVITSPGGVIVGIVIIFLVAFAAALTAGIANALLPGTTRIKAVICGGAAFLATLVAGAAIFALLLQ